MKKIQEFLLNTFGTFGFIIYGALLMFLCAFPVLMFNLPLWLTIVLALLIQFVLVNIPFVIEILYVIGLFGAINGKQDFFAIVYYIIFAVMIVPTIVRFIRVLLSKE